MSGVRCSVVIPSHNRAHSLERMLEALARQTVPPATFEVTVILDGSTDGSAAVLERWQRGGPLTVRWQWQPRQGQAAARNSGARLSAAPLLVFLDDDVIPSAGLLAAHLRWHQQDTHVVVVGDAPVVRRARPSWYDLIVWAWWTDEYHRRARPGRTKGYRDVCAGNFSVRRDDFWRAGGFDPAFRGYGGEDYDLGVRLLRSGARLVIDSAALAHHEHAATPFDVLRNMRDEGRQDVLLGRKHPAIRRGLRLMQPAKPGTRILFACPWLTDLPAGAARRLLPLYERLGLRGRWVRLFGRLRHYAYWRGVRDALGSWAALRRYQAEAAPPRRVPFDLSDGLPQELPPMSADDPVELDVTLQGRPIGLLHLDQGLTGPMRPALAGALTDQLHRALLIGLVEAGAVQAL